jgi:enoyl-CoA hydratase/carnithine racemase
MGEVRTEQRGRVLVATMDNPPHALMDTSIVDGLEAIIERADADDGVGAVVLTGARADRFIAHYDVGELLAAARAGGSVGRRAAAASVRVVGALRHVPRGEEALGGTQLAGVVALERFHAMLLAMSRSGAVFVAALNGSAMGGGCELALSCDFRLIADGDHRLGQPEILFGFPPGGGGTQRLTRLLGPARALRLMLEGWPLSPAQALELGIVDEVVPADGVVERAVELAGRLAARPKAGVRATKRAVYDGGSLPLAEGMRVERSEFLAALGTPDAVEAMQAYVDMLERTGELPGYDPETLERALTNGRFTAS